MVVNRRAKYVEQQVLLKAVDNVKRKYCGNRRGKGKVLENILGFRAGRKIFWKSSVGRKISCDSVLEGKYF